MRLNHVSAIIADDHRGTREIVLEILKSTGMRDIRQAEDGAQAFALVCERAPDILLLGAELPSDALATLRQVRYAPNCPDRRLAVIMMPASATPARIAAMRDAGATEIVTKPLTSGKLLGRIQATLLQPREFVEAETYVGPDRRRHRNVNYAGPFRRATDEADDVFEIDAA